GRAFLAAAIRARGRRVERYADFGFRTAVAADVRPLTGLAGRAGRFAITAALLQTRLVVERTTAARRRVRATVGERTRLVDGGQSPVAQPRDAVSFAELLGL